MTVRICAEPRTTQSMSIQALSLPLDGRKLSLSSLSIRQLSSQRKNRPLKRHCRHPTARIQLAASDLPIA